MKRNGKDTLLSWTSYTSELSREETVGMFQERAQMEAVSFSEHLALIDREITRTHPLSLLSSFSTYFLTSLSPSKEIDEGVTMVQAHGEVMQAMILRHQWSEFAVEDHPSNVLHRVGLSVDLAMRAFSMRRLGEMSLTDSKEESARKQVIAFVRGNTQANRNWGYSYQTFRVVREVFAPLDADLRRLCGASASEILDFWSAITKRVEDRMNVIIRAASEVDPIVWTKIRLSLDSGAG